MAYMDDSDDDWGYPECCSTCDYCGELEMKPFPFFDARTQLGACDLCVRTYGEVELLSWVNSLPKKSI